MDRIKIDELEDLLGEEGAEHMKQAEAELAKGLRQGATCCVETLKLDDPRYVKKKLLDALITMEKARPEERSELSRRFAICITDMEKVFAYYHTYICDCSLGEAT